MFYMALEYPRSDPSLCPSVYLAESVLMTTKVPYSPQTVSNHGLCEMAVGQIANELVSTEQVSSLLFLCGESSSGGMFRSLKAIL